MEITIKKVSENDRGERFVLVELSTRRVITVHDTSEHALRRFFAARGVGPELLDHCFERARSRYADASRAQPAVDHAADTSEDDLLAGLGFDDTL